MNIAYAFGTAILVGIFGTVVGAVWVGYILKTSSYMDGGVYGFAGGAIIGVLVTTILRNPFSRANAMRAVRNSDSRNVTVYPPFSSEDGLKGYFSLVNRPILALTIVGALARLIYGWSSGA